MNTETQLARRSNNPIASIRTATLIALFALPSAGALAEQQPVLSLADLDLSTAPRVYGSSCSVVLNKKRLLNSVTSPAFFPATGCNRADRGLCHFHASDATSPKMRAN